MHSHCMRALSIWCIQNPQQLRSLVKVGLPIESPRPFHTFRYYSHWKNGLWKRMTLPKASTAPPCKSVIPYASIRNYSSWKPSKCRAEANDLETHRSCPSVCEKQTLAAPWTWRLGCSDRWETLKSPSQMSTKPFSLAWAHWCRHPKDWLSQRFHPFAWASNCLEKLLANILQIWPQS